MEKDPTIRSEEEVLELADQTMAGQEVPTSSTALVVRPLSRWEEFKKSVNFSPKRTKLYQKTMELKEKLEESDNPLIAKAMNAVGAAEDIIGSAKKVVVPEAKKRGLELLKEVIPNFDPIEFYANMILQLRPIINAFNEGDREFLFDMAAPERYPYLEQKMREIRKSVNDPNREFEAFILRYPKRPHILNVSIDDPARPSLMLKFKVRKTAERVLTEKEREEIEMERSLRKERVAAGLESEQLRGDETLKVVAAVYVVAFQFSSELQEWQIYDFHEAKMDLYWTG